MPACRRSVRAIALEGTAESPKAGPSKQAGRGTPSRAREERRRSGDGGKAELTLQYLLFNSPRYQAVDPGACAAYGLSYTDPECGEQLVEMVEVSKIVLDLVKVSGELDKASCKELAETARLLQRSVRLTGTR